jgi:hypothetical protein
MTVHVIGAVLPDTTPNLFEMINCGRPGDVISPLTQCYCCEAESWLSILSVR